MPAKPRRKTTPDRGREAAQAELAVPQTSPDGAPGEVVHRHDSPSSIELSRNAKGQASWTIKLYADRDGMDAAVSQALDIDTRLQTETPTNDQA